MNNKLKLVLVFFFSLLISTLSYTQEGYEIVLETDFEGNVVQGSKEELIKQIRKGKPVRVGYQLDFNKDNVSDFDHWTEAEFITILDNDVFTQIRNINLQSPQLEIPQVDIIPMNTMWTAILGTNGVLKNRFVYEELEYEKDANGNPIITEELEKELKRREVRTWKVATFWAVDR